MVSIAQVAENKVARERKVLLHSHALHLLIFVSENKEAQKHAELTSFGTYEGILRVEEGISRFHDWGVSSYSDTMDV